MSKLNIAAKSAGNSVAATEFNKIVNEIDTPVYFLSRYGAVSDAVLTTGSSTAGKTDNTAAIQAILNLAGATTPLKIVVDGRFATDGLFIKDNTWIYCLPGCGFILRNGSNRSLVMNANTSFDPANRTEKNILIQGGIWNGNILNQTVKGTAAYGLVCVFHFAGVENLSIENVEIRDHKTYSFGLWNIGNERILNPKIIANVSNELNSDGVHADGNCDNVFVSNVQFYGFDDAVAVNCDDGYQESPTHYTYPFYSKTKTSNNGHNATGPVKNFVLENLFLIAGGWYGIRVLALVSRMENFTARNVAGETYGKWLELNNAGVPGAGNIGNISIEDVNVKVIGSGTTGYQADINTFIERVVIKKHKRRYYEAGGVSFVVGPMGHVKTLVLEDLDHYDPDSLSVAEIVVEGYIETLIIRASKFKKAAATASSIVRVTTGIIKRIILSDVEVENYNNIVRYEGGDVSFIQANNINHIGAADGEGSFYVASGQTLADLELGVYFGYLPTSGSGTITKQRGFALAGTFETPDAITDPGAGAFEDIVFDTFFTDTLVNTSGVWTSAVNDNSFGHKGEQVSKISKPPGNAKIKFRNVAGTGAVVFGFNADPPPAQAYAYIGLQILSGALTALDGGNNVNLGVSITGNWYQIVRTGMSFKLQTSTDDVTYTDLHLYTAKWANFLWPMCDIAGGASYSLHNPKAQGLL